MSTPEIARLLRAIADVIERNSPAEIDALTAAMSGADSRRAKPRKAPNRVKDKRGDIANLDGITNQIIASNSRDEAFAALSDANLTKRELTKLAAPHNIHIVKEDTVDLITLKIVESLVGARLNSKAIRGEK